MRHGGRRHEVKVGVKESCRWTKDGEGRARVGWRTEGPEEAGRSHGWSTPGIIKGRHVETVGMASAKSRSARREVGHAFPSGLAVWASKLSRRLVSWFGPQNQDPRGLARLSGPRTCRGTWRSWFGWFGPQNHQGGGFPDFRLKIWSEGSMGIGRTEGGTDGAQRLRGVEARCAKHSRPSDEDRKRFGLKRPCVGC